MKIGKPKNIVSGETPNAQAAVWLNVTVVPATVTVPVRAEPELASAANVNPPAPLPEPEPDTWIHESLLTAVHVQPIVVVTVTANDPPLGYPSIVDPTDKVYLH